MILQIHHNYHPKESQLSGSPPPKDQQDAGEVLKSFQPEKALAVTASLLLRKSHPSPNSLAPFFSQQYCCQWSQGRRCCRNQATLVPGDFISLETQACSEFARILLGGYLLPPTSYRCADGDSVIRFFWIPYQAWSV